MLIQASSEFSDLKQDSEKFRYIQLFAQSTKNAVNGNLEVLKNIKCVIKEVSFTATNTDTLVNHGLGFTPNAYILAGSTVAMSIYDGSQTANSSNIVLKSNAVGTARILIF